MGHSTSHIKTERLWLREIDESDTDTIVRLRSDPEVYCYFSNLHGLTADGHRKWYWGNYVGNTGRLEIVRQAADAGADCIKIQTYTADSLTVYCDNDYFKMRVIRPGYGLKPKYYSGLIGRSSKRKIRRGQPIKESDLE